MSETGVAAPGAAGLGFLVLALGRSTPLLGLVMAAAPGGAARHPVKLFLTTDLCWPPAGAWPKPCCPLEARRAVMCPPPALPSAGGGVPGAAGADPMDRWPGAAAAAIGLSAVSTVLLGRGLRWDRVEAGTLGLTLVQLCRSTGGSTRPPVERLLTPGGGRDAAVRGRWPGSTPAYPARAWPTGPDPVTPRQPPSTATASHPNAGLSWV
jgi:hypothetical protein